MVDRQAIDAVRTEGNVLWLHFGRWRTISPRKTLKPSQWGKSDECPHNRNGLQNWAEEAQSNEASVRWECRPWSDSQKSVIKNTYYVTTEGLRAWRVVFVMRCKEAVLREVTGKTLSLKSVQTRKLGRKNAWRWQKQLASSGNSEFRSFVFLVYPGNDWGTPSLPFK